ncbi:uncharacterized protein LOC113345986 isoform X2 [Papaver somniferum]|uniref:uncharacterized protein LOC113345986 isoform X2 n=1 Tax=Papaver somniferum TaxID=3469 RepID=UPI000E6FB6AC|nr:uncharacterized protein LOC113345986 isoform X2 [Papaver somniferum]
MINYISAENSIGSMANNQLPQVPQVIQDLNSIDLNFNLNQLDRYIEIQEQQVERLCIMEVPSYMKARRRAAYEPSMVSIGPYHYGKPQLLPMQAHKTRAVVHFLKRCGKAKESFLQELRICVVELRNHYDRQKLDLMLEWQDDENFIRLMMVDGIFLLEYLSATSGNRHVQDYARNDPYFGHRGNTLSYNYVMQDLLMLENQVPYNVLYKLLAVSHAAPNQTILPENTHFNLCAIMMSVPPEINTSANANIQPGYHHFLDAYMKGRAKGNVQPRIVEDRLARKISASALQKYAIKYTVVESYDSMAFDSKSGTLNLPSLLINEQSIVSFLNSRAYDVQGSLSII